MKKGQRVVVNYTTAAEQITTFLTDVYAMMAQHSMHTNFRLIIVAGRYFLSIKNPTHKAFQQL